MTAFNSNWKFFLEGLNDIGLDASQRDYNDSNWENKTLPHDWSIEQGYNKQLGDGATAYILGGVAWYRKHFDAEEYTIGKTAILYFDGIYNITEIYLNGELIKKHYYGYTPIQIDISNTIDSKNNVIAIKVDHSRYVDSRWYTGSGIYRKASLTFYDDAYILKDELKIDSFIKPDGSAEIDIRGFLHTSKNSERLNIIIKDKSGKIILTEEREFSAAEFKLNTLKIENPLLWDLDSPNLYSLSISKDNNEIIAVNFGIRTIHFDSDKGFFLNGKPVKIKGVCLHHEAGLVGSAVPKDIWKYRFENLKALGCNAIRTAHNPQSQEFLDLCDEMGLLVQEEFFDEWDYPKDKRQNGMEQHDDYLSRGYNIYFQEDGERVLKDTINFHYNHPSIFQWSIGNEIEWTYKGNREATGFFDSDASGNYFWKLPPNDRKTIKENLKKYSTDEIKIGETANKLSKWVKEVDTTRPVVANCILPSASFESGYCDAIDIVGFSYRRVMYDWAHKVYPDKPIMGCENVGQYHEWKAVEDREFVSGTFLWTGIDYMGESSESHRAKWSEKATGSGLLDLIGAIKPSGHMFKSLWTTSPTLFIATQKESLSFYENEGNKVSPKKGNNWEHRLWLWPNVNEHFNYEEGDSIIVEAYSNCENVELFLGDVSLGKKYLFDFEDHIYRWALSYKKESLRAVGKMANGEHIECCLIPTSKPNHLKITANKTHLNKNSHECVILTASLQDKENYVVKDSLVDVVFNVKGRTKILGCDNGSIYNTVNPLNMHSITKNGKVYLILQENGECDSIEVEAYVNTPVDISGDKIRIQIK
jgi:hypothetical protein